MNNFRKTFQIFKPMIWLESIYSIQQNFLMEQDNNPKAEKFFYPNNI